MTFLIPWFFWESATLVINIVKASEETLLVPVQEVPVDKPLSIEMLSIKNSNRLSLIFLVLVH
jgi:hypothetical protein